MEQTLVVLCTFPDSEVATKAIRTLVGERLAACGNLLPGLRSIYRWEGELKDDPEALAILKTTSGGFAALEARLAELHPYECPEIIGLEVNKGHEPYLAWVLSSVGTS